MNNSKIEDSIFNTVISQRKLSPSDQVILRNDIHEYLQVRKQHLIQKKGEENNGKYISKP